MFNEQIIKKIVSTWKSEQQKKDGNVYTFYVDPFVNKFQLREALEEAFAVKIERICSLREKPVIRNRQRNVQTKLRKKIFVKLRDGYKIGGEFNPEKLKINIGNSPANNPRKD